MPQVMNALEFVALGISLPHLANPEQSSSVIASVLIATGLGIIAVDASGGFHGICVENNGYLVYDAHN